MLASSTLTLSPSTLNFALTRLNRLRVCGHPYGYQVRDLRFALSVTRSGRKAYYRRVVSPYRIKTFTLSDRQASLGALTFREFPKSGYFLNIYLRFWEFTVIRRSPLALSIKTPFGICFICSTRKRSPIYIFIQKLKYIFYFLFIIRDTQFCRSILLC